MIKLPFHSAFNLRSGAGRERMTRPLKEGTMCYSKYWLTEDERRAREARAKEVEAKRRTETVNATLVEAEKEARAEAFKTRVSAPAK